MDRIPLEDHTDLHEIVTGVYDVVFADSIGPDELELYEIESEHVEAEIELPYIGINRREWNEEWTTERRLEVLLHEFAHVDEGPDEPDHGPAFYDRLAELAGIAEAYKRDVDALFDDPVDFDRVKTYIVDSVNEYTIEPELESVAERRGVLEETLSETEIAQ